MPRITDVILSKLETIDQRTALTNEKLAQLTGEFKGACNKIDTNHEDIVSLRGRSDKWDVVTSFLAIMAGVFGYAVNKQ